MSGSVDLGGRRIIKKIFFKQKTAYEIVTGDWSSDVCSSDLIDAVLIIFINGVLQEPSKAYIFDGGSSVQFLEAPDRKSVV